MGSTTDTSLTNMIQDAILKLCTHNITFTKSLEIDGIICVSPGEAQPDIVVKMHRTILKPQTKPDPPVKSWDETYNTNPNPHPFTTGYTLPQVSYPQGDQRMSYASAIPDRSRTFVRNTNTGSPRNRRTHITHTAATHEQPEVEFATHDPTQENLPTPGETIPVATQMTPVGLAETSSQGPEDSQCSRSEEEEQQTSLTSKKPDNKRKVESETFSNDDPPDKQAKIEIKEEPITIEVNDEDDDINDGDMNTGDWMQDNTLDSLDNTAEQNGNTQQQMQGTDPNSVKLKAAFARIKRLERRVHRLETLVKNGDTITQPGHGSLNTADGTLRLMKAQLLQKNKYLVGKDKQEMLRRVIRETFSPTELANGNRTGRKSYSSPEDGPRGRLDEGKLNMVEEIAFEIGFDRETFNQKFDNMIKVERRKQKLQSMNKMLGEQK